MHQLFSTYMTGFHCYSYGSLPLCWVLCLERTWWSDLCGGWWRHWCLALCKENPKKDTLISFLLVWPLSTPSSFLQPFPVLCKYSIENKFLLFFYWSSICTWKKLCNLPGPQLAFHHYLIFLGIEFHSECPVNIKYLNCFNAEFLSKVRNPLIFIFLCIYNGHYSKCTLSLPIVKSLCCFHHSHRLQCFLCCPFSLFTQINEHKFGANQQKWICSL